MVEDGGGWEGDVNDCVVKKSRTSHKKIYSSKQPRLLRKDLLTFNPITSCPALAMWERRPHQQTLKAVGHREGS